MNADDRCRGPAGSITSAPRSRPCCGSSSEHVGRPAAREGRRQLRQVHLALGHLDDPHGASVSRR